MRRRNGKTNRMKESAVLIGLAINTIVFIARFELNNHTVRIEDKLIGDD
jgi:hypothetical protein